MPRRPRPRTPRRAGRRARARRPSPGRGRAVAACGGSWRCRVARARLRALFTDSSLAWSMPGGLAGAEAEHVAQHQDGALPGRQELQRGDERQRDRLPGLVAGLRAGSGVGQLVQQQRPGRARARATSPSRVGSGGSSVALGRAWPRAAGQRPAARSGSGWWRSGTARCAPRPALEAAQPPPGRQQGLLHRVLGVLRPSRASGSSAPGARAGRARRAGRTPARRRPGPGRSDP